MKKTARLRLILPDERDAFRAMRKALNDYAAQVDARTLTLDVSHDLVEQAERTLSNILRASYVQIVGLCGVGGCSNDADDGTPDGICAEHRAQALAGPMVPR